MKLARLALGAAASLCSGFVAAWIANCHQAAMYLGILLLALFIPNHYLLWDEFQFWYHLTFLVSLFPLTLLGAMLKLPGGKMRPLIPLPNSCISLGAVPKFPGTASRLPNKFAADAAR